VYEWVNVRQNVKRFGARYKCMENTSSDAKLFNFFYEMSPYLIENMLLFT